jgi:hypothetical protein
LIAFSGAPTPAVMAYLPGFELSPEDSELIGMRTIRTTPALSKK